VVSVGAGASKKDPTLSQALHMLNGTTVQGKIAQGGLIKVLLKEGKTPPQVIETLFVRALCRKPMPEETDRLMNVVAQAESPQQGLDDVFWAILNSREFVFNH